MGTVVIRAENGDHLTIDVRGRMHAGADDYWDGNWLVAPIAVSVGGFTGSVGSALRAEELVGFRIGLEALYESLEGEAALDSLEDWLHVVARGDGAGHIEMTAAVKDEPGIGNELKFRLYLDQTFLPDIISALHEIERQFPVIGHPRAD